MNGRGNAGRLGAATGVAVALAAIAAGGSTAHPSGEGGSPTADASGRFLPDLVEILPARVGIATRGSVRGTRTLLTFSAAAENWGAGPLIIRGSRSPDTGTMTATQVIARTDGSRERVPDVGRLRYVTSRDHSHWHLLGFMRFELRSIGGVSLRRDRKTGFCLGDRYDATPGAIPGEPESGIYRRRCGLFRPDLTRVTEGISVGFGDEYPARLEGQSIDITGVPTGRYVLVQRVNPDHKLLDLHDDNDVSSALVKIVRRGARTHARILAWCTSTESCPTPER
jgi:hypothetical protein